MADMPYRCQSFLPLSTVVILAVAQCMGTGQMQVAALWMLRVIWELCLLT